MAMISVDTFAVTNPAFCSLVIRAFVEGYITGDPEGSLLPLILLPIPLVLTEETAATFAQTKSSTGLIPWLGRYPEVTVMLGNRIRGSANVSRQALLFGIRQRVLTVLPSGRVIPDADGLMRKPSFSTMSEVGKATSLAKRLGTWCGQVRSAQTILISLGVNR
ncbi:three component ABC system middle component [Singulisphaera sp. Ch08]|uniref:Three component ABC system middle component n=1 Tax=Singulisphaera sp. Ch08 TaxID=3120278 RepID=A0AAU7C8W3_9BACT